MSGLTISSPVDGTEFKCLSQVGQDQFAFEKSGRKLNGTFIDIGCNDPYFHNNTAVLEKIGWDGVCVDIEHFDYSTRRALFVQADVREPVFAVEKFLKAHGGGADYLSVDADDATFDALARLIPFFKFGVITVEHDKYRVGPGAQHSIHDFLKTFGYKREVMDVKAPEAEGMPWSNQPFEDWYVRL